MKRYIIILLSLVPLLSMAQASDEVLRLIHKMEEQCPGHYRKDIINLGEGYYESDEWRAEHEDAVKAEVLKQLSDSVEKAFIRLSGTGRHSYQRCCSQGGNDTIQYAIALDGDTGKKPEFSPGHGMNAPQFITKEAAHFEYQYDGVKDQAREVVALTKNDTTTKVTGLLDMRPVKKIFDELAQRSDAEKHKVEYVFNIDEPQMKFWLPYSTTEEDADGRQISVDRGSDRHAKNGACRGTMLVFPAEKADSIAEWTANRIYAYVTRHKDKAFLYGFGTQDNGISLNTDLHDVSATNDHFCTTTDDFGRLVMLYIDRIDSTFALPRNYEKMLSYRHGEVEMRPSYLEMEKAGEKKNGTLANYKSWRVRTLEALGVANIPATRIERTGGNTTRSITTMEIFCDADSLARISKRVTSNDTQDILRREVHLPEADTLEITLSHKYADFPGVKEKLAYRFFGKDGHYTGTIQHIFEEQNKELPLPADLRWMDELADSLKEKGVLEEHAVKYEYGDKNDPESCGEVTGRLFVSKAEDFKNLIPLIIKPLAIAVQNYTTEHKEETYHFITNIKENSTRYNDYHLYKIDNEAKRICLLIVDDVKGPYLLPEEWYKITRYKYGKKKYLK